MGLLNPVHGLVFPFLCVCTIPLALFAGITTVLAFSVLMFRVAVVYIDIALALVPQYLTGWGKRGAFPVEPLPRRTPRAASRDCLETPVSPISSVSSGSEHSTPTSRSTYPVVGRYSTCGRQSPHRRRSSYGFSAPLRGSRRSSQASLASMGTITSIHEEKVAPSAESGLTPSVGLDRDFEGIGGWRLDDRDDGNWTNINSRLELPLERTSTRHHQRSQSLGPLIPSEDVWLMSKGYSTRADRSPSSPDRKIRERAGSLSPNKAFASPNGRGKSIRLPSALTALDPDNGYFNSPVSTKSSSRSTP